MANPADAGRTVQQPGLLADLGAGTAIHGTVHGPGAGDQADSRDRQHGHGGQLDPDLAPAYQPHGSFHGRPVSWVAVTLVMVAFTVGGLALVFGPIWWLFWVSAGVTAVGALIAAATNIFEDWY